MVPGLPTRAGYADWEGVLVNDGSPDGSRDIAAAYCEKDTRFKLVDKPTVVYRARAMRASLRPRRLSLRFWIPTTGLRLMRAA